MEPLRKIGCGAAVVQDVHRHASKSSPWIAMNTIELKHISKPQLKTPLRRSITMFPRVSHAFMRPLICLKV